MYCSHCGKEIAETAMMCPNCGAPTNNQIEPKVKTEKNPLVLSGFVISIISFIFGFIWMVIGLAKDSELASDIVSATSSLFTLLASSYLIYLSILPSFGALALSISGLCKNSKGSNKAFGITATILSGVIILFYFIVMSILMFGNN